MQYRIKAFRSSITLLKYYYGRSEKRYQKTLRFRKSRKIRLLFGEFCESKKTGFTKNDKSNSKMIFTLHTRKHINTCAHASTQTHTHMKRHTNTNTLTHTHTHAHTHTHTHTHTNKI